MKTSNISDELYAFLKECGADLVGFADLSHIAECSYPRGASVAVKLPDDVLAGIQEGPTKEYLDCYNELNAKLNNIVKRGAEFLISRGYDAYANSTDQISYSEDNISLIPHKTVACLAGLGWIGKSCLLVTPEYGGSVRISALFTDADIECGKPITESRCPEGCNACVKACPAGALKGKSWKAGMKRDEIIDWKNCSDTQIRIMKERTGIATDLCGQCFVVCPFTRKRQY